MFEALGDLTVIEGSSFIAGPSCALHLAQMGAKVIRFDMIGGGPDYRRMPRGAEGESLYWQGLNKGKLSVAIDLHSAEGRELACEMITASGPGRGLFVTNYPEKGFLSHAALAARRTDLITLRVQGWGTGRNGVDYTVNAAVGVPFMTGPLSLASDIPVNNALPAWDLLAGAYGAFALLAAERRRRASGQGGEIRLALSDLAIGSLAHLGQVAEVYAGPDRERFGNGLYGAFGRDFVTRDGRRLMIVAITPRQWSGLVEALGLQTQMTALETELGLSFATDEALRFTHSNRLFRLIETAIAAEESAALMARFEAAGVCWESYRTLREAVLEDERLVSGNPLFQIVEHPGGNRYPTPRGLLRTDDAPPSGTVAPRLGQHTEQILAELLGLSSVAIGQLFDRGVVAGPR